MKTNTKTRWFWAWEDEKEEQWLREMAQEGWHLIKPEVFGRYTFEQGEFQDIVYRLDYNAGTKDKAEYYQLFEDAGWEFVDEMGGWQYFRKENTDGDTLEIFTDNESKAKKYSRVLIYLTIFLPIFIIFMTNLSQSGVPWVQAVSVIFGVLMFLYAYAMVRLLIRIGQVKRKL